MQSILNENIYEKDIEEELLSCYKEYGEAVIKERAIPDVRDGLKPVQRRILWAMKKLGLSSRAKYKKSARVVGDVIGKYHPHGDSAVYEALVRMSQPFSMRYPYVDGQGNFGDRDEQAAAMRYTECRLSSIAEELFFKLEPVDMKDNYDGSEKEPVLLASELPTVLLNPSSGIAVALSSDIPSHEIKELIRATIRYIDGDKEFYSDLIPDLVSGSTIYREESTIEELYREGRGSIKVSAELSIYEDRREIVLKNLPFSASSVIEKIKQLELDEIERTIDESDENSSTVRIFYKKEIDLNYLINTIMSEIASRRITYSMLVINSRGKPELMSLEKIMKEWLEYRHYVLIKTAEKENRQLDKKRRELELLQKVVRDREEFSRTVFDSKESSVLLKKIEEKYPGYTEDEYKKLIKTAIERFSNYEIKQLEEEVNKINEKIRLNEKIILDYNFRNQTVKESLMTLEEKINSERKTKIEEEFNYTKDYIENRPVLVVVTQSGKIYQFDRLETQSRQGKGRRLLKDESLLSFIEENQAEEILAIDSEGYATRMKLAELVRQKYSDRKFIDIISCQDEYLAILHSDSRLSIIYMEEFRNGNRRKRIFEPEDRPKTFFSFTGYQDSVVVAVSSDKKIIKIPFQQFKITTRLSKGVKVMTGEVDAIALLSQSKEDSIVLVDKVGYGKRISLNSIRSQNRAGVGVNIKINHPIVSILPADRNIILASKHNFIKINPAEELLEKSRHAHVLKLIDLPENEQIVKAISTQY